MAFAFSMIGAKKRNAELTVDLDVQREKRREALPVRSSNVILQGINVGIRLAGVQIHDRAELQLFRQRENAPGHHAIGDVVRQDSINVGTNHRLLKGNEYAGKIVQISASL